MYRDVEVDSEDLILESLNVQTEIREEKNGVWTLYTPKDLSTIH